MAASASGSIASSSVTEEELTLIVKWSGKEYTVRVCGDDSVGELKRRICEFTTVLPKRQKLLYPKVISSKLADDSVLISQLPLKSSLKMTMIGYSHFYCCWICDRKVVFLNKEWKKGKVFDNGFLLLSLSRSLKHIQALVVWVCVFDGWCFIVDGFQLVYQLGVVYYWNWAI